MARKKRLEYVKKKMQDWEARVALHME